MGYRHIPTTSHRDSLPIFHFSQVYCMEKIHGCFTPETLVMLPNGEERSIGEIIHDPTITHVLSYDELSSSYVPKLVTGRFRRVDPSAKWVRLSLENGRGLVCTEDHPIFSRDRKKYIRADEIQNGEDIESPTE